MSASILGTKVNLSSYINISDFINNNSKTFTFHKTPLNLFPRPTTSFYNQFSRKVWLFLVLNVLILKVEFFLLVEASKYFNNDE